MKKTIALLLALSVCGCSSTAETETAAEPVVAEAEFTATDYSDMDNWAVNDYDNTEKKDTRADVFFIYGTNVTEADQENCIAKITDKMKATTTKLDVGAIQPRWD